MQSQSGTRRAPIAVVAALAAVATGLVACSRSPEPTAGATPSPRAAQVDHDRLVAADTNGEWLSYGKGYSEQRFSPLKQIDASTVATLGLAWYHEFDANTDRGMEATPLVADGVLYVSTAWSRVHAFEAATGKLLWSYDPKVDGQKGKDACCDVVNRGVALWKGRVYVGALDGRLIAIDAATGQEVWSQQTTDTAWPYTITGAPRVVKGKVLIGQGGAELGVRGYVSAYDADTGALAWRFYTTPNPEGKPDGAASDAIFASKGAATWSGDGWKKTGGGGTPWDAITYDPKTDLVYIGVGNGSPWSHQERSDGKGDNWFLSSILALKPDTGEYVWHYQTTPADNWDFTATQHIMTADLSIGGEPRHVVMQAPKNGFFYVLDAASGKLLSAEKFAPANWASRIDLATGRPVENPKSRYPTPATARMSVGPIGGHNWNPMAFHPDAGLVFIPSIRSGFTYTNDPEWQFVRGRWNLGLKGAFGAPLPPAPDDRLPDAKAQAALEKMPKSFGQLMAWDPVAQQPRWIIEDPKERFGGALATAGGLVFAGDGESFNAYDVATGKTLWSEKTAAAIMAAPSTFEIDGTQYVAVTVGYGGASAVIGGTHPRRPGRLYVYKLGGTAKAPDHPPFEPMPPLDLATVTASTGDPAKGGKHFEAWCGSCHIGGTYIPDLTRSPRIASADVFKAVVIDGALRPRGMASFAQWLTPADAEDLRAYFIAQATAGQKASKQTPATDMK